MRSPYTHKLTSPIRRRCLAWLVPLVLCALGTPLSGMAAERDLTPQSFVPAPAAVTAKDAARLAREQVGGKLISIKPDKKLGGYTVRLLVDGGRVVKVRVDQQGRVRRNQS